MGALSTNLNPWLTPREWPDAEKQLSLMDRLFNRLDGMYPNKWRSAFGTPAAVQNWRDSWAEAFDQEGITPNEVMAGIVACRRMYDWPPSLPEFIKACRPNLDYERAFNEAVEQMRKRDDGKDEWSSPAVYWAAVQIGNVDLMRNTYISIKGRWATVMDRVIAEIKSGKLPNTIPERLAALPSPGNTATTKEKARKNLEKIRRVIGASRLLNA